MSGGLNNKERLLSFTFNLHFMNPSHNNNVTGATAKTDSCKMELLGYADLIASKILVILCNYITCYTYIYYHSWSYGHLVILLHSL